MSDKNTFSGNPILSCFGLDSEKFKHAATQVFESQQVDRETFEVMRVFHDLTFGPKGYVESIGPTWDMINDKRFEVIEDLFVSRKLGMLGGVVESGVEKVDGDMISVSASSLEEYSMILGEGRHWVKVAALEGIPYADLHKLDEERLWNLLRRENGNWFFRDRSPNPLAKRLYGMLRADLTGLVGDYAEIAKIQEWFKLEQDSELASSADMENGEIFKVYAEVDMLAKALNYRVNLQILAAKIMAELGIDKMTNLMEQTLTKGESDTILRMIYSAKWPDDRTKLVSDITAYIAGLKFQGSPEYRSAVQEAKAKESADAFKAAIADGSEQVITRETDGTVEQEMTEEERIIDEINSNPLKQYLFVTLSDAESALNAANLHLADADALLSEEGSGEQSLADHNLVANEQEATIARKQEIIDILTPVFERHDYFVDDDVFRLLMGKVVDADPVAAAEAVQMTTLTSEEAAAISDASRTTTKG